MSIYPALFHKGAIVQQKGNKQLWEVLDVTDPDDLPDYVQTLKQALPHVRYTVRNMETGTVVEGERHYLLDPI